MSNFKYGPFKTHVNEISTQPSQFKQTTQLTQISILFQQLFPRVLRLVVRLILVAYSKRGTSQY